MVWQKPPGIAQEVDERAEQGRHTALQAPRRPDAGQPTHQQPQVEAAGVHEHALQDVGVTPQMYAAHRARLVEMGKGTFQALAALAQQPLAPRAPRMRRRFR